MSSFCVPGAAAARKPARKSEQQVTVLRRVLKLTVKAAEAMSKGAVNFLGGNPREAPSLANGAIVPACHTRSSLSSPAAAPGTPDKKVRALQALLCIKNASGGAACMAMAMISTRQQEPKIACPASLQIWDR